MRVPAYTKLSIDEITQIFKETDPLWTGLEKIVLNTRDKHLLAAAAEKAYKIGFNEGVANASDKGLS